ncbi:MAG: aldehyde ferredoxin oxidoreductase family protein [bacterium]|nr:MAG: aldehyde ferredoxin oxidoreductase family protein [bacterium]
MHGWMGKVLRINLTEKTVQEKPIDLDVWKMYLGGRGFGAKVLYDEVNSNVNPLEPENVLIFATGPLTGTKAATPGRFSVSTKSPLTGTVMDANSGGRWGVYFKKCGFDALIVTGKSATPIYITIFDDKIEIKDAAHLWGKDVHLTTDMLTESEGKGTSIMCIGPAGENQVLISAIMNDKDRALARGGVGAVMGAKNLKAVVVKGTKKVEIADPERMKFVTYEANKLVRANPITSKGLPEFGTSVLVNIINEAGIFPARNYQESQFETADKISGESITDQILTKKAGCWGCIIQCARKTKTANEEGEGPEYESNWALGANCGIDDLEAITEANYLCNLMGLDTISTGGTISCAMELNERGIIDTGIQFGETGKLKDFIRKIAYREGIGNELALGSKRFSAKYNAAQYSMQVKGLELPAYDPRGAQGQGLAYAISNRGGCHLRGGYVIGTEILGVPRMIDRFASVGKAGHAVRSMDLGAAVDSMVCCRFSNYALNEYVWARLLSAVTGESYQPEEIMKVGERIVNLERLYNLREGFTRKDDTLPKRLLEEPVKEGPSRGRTVNLESMLDEYYQFRGWDQNGVPGEKKLKELGLEVNSHG